MMMGARAMIVRRLSGFLILSFSLVQANTFQDVLERIAEEQQAGCTLDFQKVQKDHMSRQQWPAVCNKAKDAVVQVIAYTNAPQIFAPFRTPERGGGRGSGFLISTDGYILTNYHVVDEAVFLCVRFPGIGKDIFQVELIGCCPDRDVALLRLAPEAIEKIKTLLNVETLPFLDLGYSDALDHGEQVLILGYPLGMENLKSSIGDF